MLTILYLQAADHSVGIIERMVLQTKAFYYHPNILPLREVFTSIIVYELLLIKDFFKLVIQYFIPGLTGRK